MELDQFKDVNLVIDKANDIFIPRQFVSQGDYKGRTLTVQITNNGSIGEVPGLTLNLNWHNEASGLTDLTAFTILDKTNSIFRIEYPDNMMTPGKVYASIQIIQDGKVTNLKQFELIVQKLAGQPVGIVEKAEFSALVAALADSNKFRTDIDKKADKTYINDYLSQVTVVPETFTNLAAIKAKYPSGKNGLMVAADNGHKYIWANNVWTDAGVYQSVGIADKSIDWNKLKVPLTRGYIILGKITIKGGTISFSNNLALDYNNGFLYPNKETALTIPNDSNPIYVTANRDTKEYSVTLSSQVSSLTNADVMIGILYLRRFFVYGQHSQEFVEYNEETYKPARNNGSIVLGDLNIDYENNTITHDSGDLIVASLGAFYRTSNSLTTKIPVDSDKQIVYVFYDFAKEKLECVTTVDMLNRSHIYLFALYQGVIYGANKEHINFIDRNRLEDREPETSVILFSNAYKIIVNETEDKCEVTIPAGSCLYVNTGGRYLIFKNELKVEYTTQNSGTTAVLLTFFYNNGNVYADYFRHKYDDVRLFSVYGGKIYGSNVSGYVVNNVENGGWGFKTVFSSKKLVFLGDSIMQGWDGVETAAHNIPYYFKNRLNLETFVNNARGGATISASGNSINTQIDNADLTNVSYLIFNGGTNDYSNGVALSDFETGFKYIVETAYSKNVDTQLYYVAPFFRSCNAERDTKADAFKTQNKAGLTLLDYFNKAVELCGEYGIPYFDGKKNSGWNMLTEASYLADMLHPTEKGYNVIGNKIVGDFESGM